VINGDNCRAAIQAMAANSPADFFASPLPPGDTYESVLLRNREWALMPRRDRSALLLEARKRDRRINCIAISANHSKDPSSLDLSHLGELETPFLPLPGESPGDATRRKVSEDASRWPVKVVAHESRLPSFINGLSSSRPRVVLPSFVNGLPSSESGIVYVIQDLRTGLFKIGRTTNLSLRMKALGVGKTARLIQYKFVSDAAAVERAAHRRYRAQRLPQTEYFHLSAPPTI
jgi:hypothetical protein